MPRNGSGTYNRAVSPYVTGTVISASTVNTEQNDIASALTQSLSLDGQTTPSANLPMGGFRHTNVANANARNTYAAAGQVQDSSFLWCGTAGGTGDAITLGPTPAIAAYAAGQKFRFIAFANNTGATTVAISGLTTKAIFLSAACQGGEIVSGDLYEILYDGTQFQLIPVERTDTQPLVVGGTDATKRVRLEVDGLTTGTTRVLTVQDENGTIALTNEFAYSSFDGSPGRMPLPKGYISGCNIANNITDPQYDINFNEGFCRDSTNSVNLNFDGGLLVKRLDANWTVGTNQGGLDTGSVSVAATYHCFLIRKDSDGAIDALFSLSATAPTMPSGYTYFRRVGSIQWNTVVIVPFNQRNDEFLLLDPAQDYSVSTLGATAATPTLSVPAGIKVLAKISVYAAGPTALRYVLVTSPDQNDGTPSATLYNLVGGGSPGVYAISDMLVRTNTSGQVRIRSSAGSTSAVITTFGWIDERL